MASDLNRKFDALVIGSGAAGSIAVKELTERGMEVLLLEAGREITPDDFVGPRARKPRPMGVGLLPRARAAAKGQPVQARRVFYAPTSDKWFVNDRENPYTTPPDAPYLWIRSRVLGGRLHVYGKMLLRMSDYDFKGYSLDGLGVDWPFAFADLAPWYDHVEQIMGIYGQSDGLDQLPDSVYRGDAELTTAEQEFRAAVQERWPERHVVSWRYAAPNLGRVPLGIAAARKTGRLTTRTDAVVRRITVDGRTGRATGAAFVDRLSKCEHTVHADVIVVCASAIESIRLLLNSASPEHPNGLGNSSGLVGRYFMDQAPSVAFGEIPGQTGSERLQTAPPDPYYPPSGGVFIPRYQNLRGDPPAPFARGFSFQAVMGRLPTPADLPAAFALLGYGEMLPHHGNTVTIDASRTDAWGIPVARIRCQATENEQQLMRAQVSAITEMTQVAGYRLTFAGSALGLSTPKPFPKAGPATRLAFRVGFRHAMTIGTAIHECGGVRMGSDPATSVLNEYNQSWDVPNLFVTDGSAFASNGLVGPTLTIMAITARACDHIAREHAAGLL